METGPTRRKLYLINITQSIPSVGNTTADVKHEERGSLSETEKPRLHHIGPLSNKSGENIVFRLDTGIHLDKQRRTTTWSPHNNYKMAARKEMSWPQHSSHVPTTSDTPLAGRSNRNLQY
jgi:hypothetical protein